MMSPEELRMWAIDRACGQSDFRVPAEQIVRSAGVFEAYVLGHESQTGPSAIQETPEQIRARLKEEGGVLIDLAFGVFSRPPSKADPEATDLELAVPDGSKTVAPE